MKKIINYILILSIIHLAYLSLSASSIINKRGYVDFPSDTTRSFKIDNFWVTPKLTFEFNGLAKSSNDTLDLITCSNFVYFPFGIIKSKLQIKSSLLKNFKTVTKRESRDLEFQVLKYKSSKLVLFFDHGKESTKTSYIYNGEIYDSEFNFTNQFKIGMDASTFYSTFFDLFPQKIQNKYNVIILESCVNGIRHIYNFKNSKLISVKFQCVDCSLEEP